MENARRFIIEKHAFLEEIGRLGSPSRKKEPKKKAQLH